MAYSIEFRRAVAAAYEDCESSSRETAASCDGLDEETPWLCAASTIAP